MKRVLGTFSLLLLAVAGAALYWRLGYSLGLPVLLFVISLAIVGKGNRLVWSAIFPFLCAALAALSYAGYSLLPSEPETVKLLFFLVLLSVLPAVVLWAATKLKHLRGRSSNAASS